MASASRSSGLRMCLRLRPNEDPTRTSILERQGAKSVLLRDTRNERYEDKSYSFDAIYDAENTDAMYSYELGDRALEPLFQGKHCTVFAHGATGSGKTYTMQGDDMMMDEAGEAGGSSSSPRAGAERQNRYGFIPLAVRNLLHLYEKEGRKDQYRIWFSLFELYCDKVRDLLQDLPKEKPFGGPGNTTRRWLGEGNPHMDVDSRGTLGADTRGKNSRFDDTDGQKSKYRIDDLPVQMDKSGEEVVAQVERVPIETLEQFTELYQRRIKLRKSGATSLNLHSSRSHCCVQISVEKIGVEKAAEVAKTRSVMSYHAKPVLQQVGKLFMVDLAGCEDNRETDNAGRGARIDESKRINSTYLSLVKVFRALRRGEPLKPVCRDDKLTRLLRVALESSSIPTLVLITVHPVPHQLQAVLNTFSYLNVAPDSGGSLVKNLTDTIQTDKQSNRPTSARGNKEGPEEGASATSGGDANTGQATGQTGQRTPPSPSRRDTKARRFQSPPVSRQQLRGGMSNIGNAGLLRQSKDADAPTSTTTLEPPEQKKPIQRNHTPTRSLRPPGHVVSMNITRSSTPRRNFSAPLRGGMALGETKSGGATSSTANSKNAEEGPEDGNPRTRTLTSSTRIGKLNRPNTSGNNNSTATDSRNSANDAVSTPNTTAASNFLKKRSGLQWSGNKVGVLHASMTATGSTNNSTNAPGPMSKSMCNIDRKALENPNEPSKSENQRIEAQSNPFSGTDLQHNTTTAHCTTNPSVASSASSKEISSSKWSTANADSAGADVEMIDADSFVDAEEHPPTATESHDPSDEIDSSRQTTITNTATASNSSTVTSTVKNMVSGVVRGGIFGSLARGERGTLHSRRKSGTQVATNQRGSRQESGRQEFSNSTNVSTSVKGRRQGNSAPNATRLHGSVDFLSRSSNSIPDTPMGESPKHRGTAEDRKSRASSRLQTTITSNFGGGSGDSLASAPSGEDFVTVAEKDALVRGFQQRERDQQKEIADLKTQLKNAEDRERETRVLLRQKASELQLRTEEAGRLEEELRKKSETILTLRNQNQELNNEINHTQFGIRERDDEIQVLKNTVDMLKIGLPAPSPPGTAVRNSLVREKSSVKRGLESRIGTSNHSSPMNNNSSSSSCDNTFGMSGARIVNSGGKKIYVEGGHNATNDVPRQSSATVNEPRQSRRSGLRSSAVNEHHFGTDEGDDKMQGVVQRASSNDVNISAQMDCVDTLSASGNHIHRNSIPRNSRNSIPTGNCIPRDDGHSAVSRKSSSRMRSDTNEADQFGIDRNRMNEADQFGISPEFQGALADDLDEDCLMPDPHEYPSEGFSIQNDDVSLPQHNNFMSDPHVRSHERLVEQQESPLHDHNPLAQFHEHFEQQELEQQRQQFAEQQKQFERDSFRDEPMFATAEKSFNSTNMQSFSNTNLHQHLEQLDQLQQGVNESHESFHSEISDMHIDTEDGHQHRSLLSNPNNPFTVKRNEPEGFGFNLIDNAAPSLMGYASRSPDDSSIL